MCREGVDTLKINPSGDEFVPFARAHQTVMNDAEVAAVAEVAKSRGKMLAAHCRSAESVKMALRHGVDVLYHCTLSDAEALDMLEAHKNRIFIAPAMGIMYSTAVGEGSGYGITKDHPVAIYFKRELDMCIENMKKLRKRGLRILPGGDYGFAWNPIGTNARDIEHFVKLLDYKPMDAIIAATKLGGEIMGMGEELGQIKAGYLADVLLVDGNPLSDVRILRDKDRLLAIMKDGAFHKEPRKRAKAHQVAAE
jgi:imidazolonepropionase-like amidohydrolase